LRIGQRPDLEVEVRGYHEQEIVELRDGEGKEGKPAQSPRDRGKNRI
jgi:hypothetical protein